MPLPACFSASCARSDLLRDDSDPPPSLRCHMVAKAPTNGEQLCSHDSSGDSESEARREWERGSEGARERGKCYPVSAICHCKDWFQFLFHEPPLAWGQLRAVGMFDR
jgi:hypothetical protein